MTKQSKLVVMLASALLLILSVASVVNARGWVQQGGNWYYQNSEGDFVTETMQSSNNTKFYLGEDGAMVTDYFLEDYGDGNNTYYFGSNGAMVTNTWVAIDPSIVSNNGDYIPTVYWYYFGATGKATKGNSGTYKRTTIDGKKYAFNEYGQMLTGWIDANGQTMGEEEENPFNGAIYYAGGDNDGALRSGWLTYYDGASDEIRSEAFTDRSVLYFYFNPSNNLKMGRKRDGQEDSDGNKNYKTKKVNGKTYAFDAGSGVMLAEWDVFKNDDVTTPSNNTEYYFSAEDDGHQVKKGWIYAVPTEAINADDYNDDELRYMYFSNGGAIIKNQIKKISGKYYGFDSTGVMKTGLVVYRKDGTYYAKFNGDNTQGEEIAKKGVYRNADNGQIRFTKDGTTGFIILPDGTKGKIHYFGSDGARKTGANTIEFADDNYVFASDNNGHFESLKKKKYYSNGILLKASSDVRYGMYISTPSCTEIDWKADYDTNRFTVLNTAGSKVKGSKTSKKDADGYYWLIAPERIVTTEGEILKDDLIGVWSVDVRWHKLNKRGESSANGTGIGLQFKADGWLNADNNEQSNKWINGDNTIVSAAYSPFQVDTTDRTVTMSQRGFGEGGSFAIQPSNDAALNFTWVED